mmetsp:Transcript_32514/g.103757  ORF Transcript_32514/g.103757 Transcript_32514/m.103757 type:complete len:479 (+) Transcript_32514:91-1527(+)
MAPVVSVTIDGDETATTMLWGRQNISTLKGNDLFWATIMEDAGRKKNIKSKQCLFCGLTFTGGPFQIRAHLDTKAPLGGRTIRLCKPSPTWVSRYDAVVAEMKRRYNDQDNDKAEADRLAAAKAEGRVTAGVVPKMFQKIGMDDVTDAWMRVVVKKALPLDIFNDPMFRKAVALTAAAGRSIVVGGEDTFMPKRKHMTSKILPVLDNSLNEKIQMKMRGVSAMGVVLVSDGWTSVSNRPIINALAALPLGLFFLAALDTSGATKDARYIADFMIQHITTYGSADVVGVCMDGVCTSSFPLIEMDFPHIFTYICPTHSLDNYMKNVCCDKEVIRMKNIEGGRLPVGRGSIFGGHRQGVGGGEVHNLPPKASRSIQGARRNGAAGGAAARRARTRAVLRHSLRLQNPHDRSPREQQQPYPKPRRSTCALWNGTRYARLCVRQPWHAPPSKPGLTGPLACSSPDLGRNTCRKRHVRSVPLA